MSVNNTAKVTPPFHALDPSDGPTVAGGDGVPQRDPTPTASRRRVYLHEAETGEGLPLCRRPKTGEGRFTLVHALGVFTLTCESYFVMIMYACTLNLSDKNCSGPFSNLFILNYEILIGRYGRGKGWCILCW